MDSGYKTTDLNGAREKTLLRTYLPCIRREMAKRDLHSYKELWLFIEPIKSKYPDFFGNLCYLHTNNCVHGKPNSVFKGSDYTIAAYALAMSFGMTPEALFGEAPQQELSESDLTMLHVEMSNLAICYTNAAQDPFDAVSQKQLSEILQARIADLPPKQQEFITEVFGFASKTPATFAEVGASRGISKQAVHDATQKGLDKLRADDYHRLLESILRF